MNPQEWALVIFTIVMQMAVGSFVILGGVHFFASRQKGIEEADKMSDRALLAIGPLVVLALIVTFLHLGNPINAPRAISNIGSSWLSREVGLAIVFAIGGAIFAFLQWRKILSAAVRNALALVVAVVGLVLVYAMAAVYRLPTVPAWDSLWTPVTFFVTTFLLGALALGAAFITNFWFMRRQQTDANDVQYQMLATTLRWLALIAVVLLGVELVIFPLYLLELSAHPSTAANETVSLLFEGNGALLTARLLLVFLGAGVFSIFVYQNASSEAKLRVLGNLAFLAFALVLVSEIMGRYLFYATMVRIGL